MFSDEPNTGDALITDRTRTFEEFLDEETDLYNYRETVARMLRQGQNRLIVNIDDLRKGMGLVSPEHLRRGGKTAKSPDDSLVNAEVSEINLPSDESDSSMIQEPPRLTDAGAGGSSPKRKRDVLEPPEFFDLRPSGRKQQSAQTEANGSDLDVELGAVGPDSGEDDNMPRMTVVEKLEKRRTINEKYF